MASSLAVYLPAGTFVAERNPFGRTIANRGLYRALARHGGFAPLAFQVHEEIQPAAAAARIGLDAAEAGAVAWSRWGQVPCPAEALFRGDPELTNLAWERRRAVGDGGYSLVGLIHTLAPPVMRERIVSASAAPVQPWDALICTSPSVQRATADMFDAWEAHLAERTGGGPAPRPMLPLLPLGVDAGAIAENADRPGARAGLRERLGLADGDILVLWVGRLSFFEKAYPQPMFRALEEAAQATGARVCFAMAGWFPNGAEDEARYREAAGAYAPSVEVRFEDGNDAAVVADLWAGADIFLSLVDNIQETFGLTPVEAMAAGLPVVVSDWDGYSYTVRDGVDGFRIPTLGGPTNGAGEPLGRMHAQQIETYQSYVGSVAQHTAVDVGRAAQALTDLIASPDLRRRMGSAGRERARQTFDWPVVVAGLHDLLDELAAIRAAVPQSAAERRAHPLMGDPFADFAGFATTVLDAGTRLAVRPGVQASDLARANDTQLDRMAAFRRAPFARAVHAFGLIERGEAGTVAEVLARFPEAEHGPLQLSLLWMCKLGVLEWIA